MKKFVKVFVGSRGIIDEVELVEIEYNGILDRSLEIFEEMVEECEDEDDKVEMEEYVEEWCNVDVDREKGVVFVGLNEEECEYWIDCDMYEDDCKRLVELFENDKYDDNEFHDIMGKFW